MGTKEKTTAKATAPEVEITKEAAVQVAEESAATKQAAGDDALVSAGKKLLADNPTRNEIFMSADGFGFFERCDAENYARSLNNKNITCVKK